MTTLRVALRGRPIPRGSTRAFIVPAKPKRDGTAPKRRTTAVVVDDNAKALTPWMRSIRSAAIYALAEQATPGKTRRQGRRDTAPAGLPLYPTERVRLRLVFTIAVTKRLPHGPDVDKLARAVADALKGVAYADDRQVGELWAAKVDATDGRKPGVAIAVEPLADERQGKGTRALPLDPPWSDLQGRSPETAPSPRVRNREIRIARSVDSRCCRGGSRIPRAQERPHDPSEGVACGATDNAADRPPHDNPAPGDTAPLAREGPRPPPSGSPRRRRAPRGHPPPAGAPRRVPRYRPAPRPARRPARRRSARPEHLAGRPATTDRRAGNHRSTATAGSRPDPGRWPRLRPGPARRAEEEPEMSETHAEKTDVGQALASIGCALTLVPFAVALFVLVYAIVLRQRRRRCPSTGGRERPSATGQATRSARPSRSARPGATTRSASTESWSESSRPRASVERGRRSR